MKKYIQIALFGIVSLGLIVGCSSANQLSSEVSTKQTNQIEKVALQANLNIANNLDEMREAAEYIVIGKYNQLKKTVNSARDVNDPSKESTVEYHEGEVYEFEVENVLKGSIQGKKILVNIPKKSEIVDPTDQKKYYILDPNYIRPKLGQKYILFLSKMDGVDFYGIPFFPYVLEIFDGHKVRIAKPDENGKNQTLQLQNRTVQIEGFNFTDEYQDIISGKSVEEILNLIITKIR